MKLKLRFSQDSNLGLSNAAGQCSLPWSHLSSGIEPDSDSFCSNIQDIAVNSSSEYNLFVATFTMTD